MSEEIRNFESHASRWIGVATLDWESDVLNEFYPEDVPSDWHLTWYANMCMAVVLPPSRWLSVDDFTVAQWCEQTQENFWFYLQCESVEQIEQAKNMFYAFSGRCAGLVVDDALSGERIDAVELLVIDESAFLCKADNLRAAHAQIAAWLSHFSGEHGLLIVDGQLAGQIREVQTLLSLMGNLS